MASYVEDEKGNFTTTVLQRIGSSYYKGGEVVWD
jgi:hypothetical protein